MELNGIGIQLFLLTRLFCQNLKTVLCKAYGPPDNLVVEEVEPPQLQPGGVIVETKAAALNFPDVLMIQGKYQSQPEFPFSPGGEFSGIVRAVAEDIDDWQVGDEVFGSTGHGCFTEQIAIPAKTLRRKPRSF